ncbi:MAG: hypothetical protein R3190_11625 [Thermoanaerobaculia bacterium]|nr:hypothetical protein [Thermoanaerobaculia bacterium]
MAEFDGERALAHAAAMVELGPRPLGSEALEQNRVYIEEQLRALGLEPYRDEFIGDTPIGDVPMANIIAEVPAADGAERRVLLQGGYYGRVAASGHLLYANGNSLFAVPVDLDTLELEGDPAPVVENIAGNSNRGASQYAVSETGHLVYVPGTSDMPTYPIVRVNRDGTSEELWAETATYGKPRFSPDGRKLAVTKMTENNWDVWVFDLDRKTSTRLTFDDGLDTEQLWSPDGQFVVWSSDRGGVDNLYRKRSDGSGEIERLTEAAEPQWATSWSPDGRYIIYMVQVQGQRDLHVLDLESGESEVYLATEFMDDFARFSPDGRWIAYSSDESGRREVYVRPFPMRGGKWQISDASGDQPMWGPEGRELYYRTDDGVMSVSVEVRDDSLVVGRPQSVVGGDYRGGLGGINLGLLVFDDYAAAPDGQSFALFGGDDAFAERHHATFVLNWFHELERLFDRP